jgi:hypothetical protein
MYLGDRGSRSVLSKVTKTLLKKQVVESAGGDDSRPCPALPAPPLRGPPARSPGSALPVWTRASLGHRLPLLGGGTCSAASPLTTRAAAPDPDSSASSSQSQESGLGFMSLFDENELLCSYSYLYWGNIAYKQEAYSLSGEKFFMSETENSCSRLCHLFSRRKIPKSCNQRSLHFIDKATNKPKCLSMSTAFCQSSSIATRCHV